MLQLLFARSAKIFFWTHSRKKKGALCVAVTTKTHPFVESVYGNGFLEAEFFGAVRNFLLPELLPKSEKRLFATL